MNEPQVSTITQTTPAIVPGTELAPLPEVTTELVAYTAAPDPKKQELEQLIAEINLDDRSSIMFFGTKTQEQMTTISEKMLNLFSIYDNINKMITNGSAYVCL